MSQPWEFEEPTREGDRFTADEAQNRRLIVVPIGYVPTIRTARGDEVDAIKLNVVDLESPEGPKTYWGTLWFGNKLIQTFRPKIGKLFLGYVSKQAVGGGFKAWVFTSLTQDQQTVGMAKQFLAANADFMETCMGDVRQEQAAAQQMAQQAQRQATPPWERSGTQQPAGWPQPQQQSGWVVADQRQGPPPGPRPLPPPTQQGPAPLPPQTAEDPWPATEYPHQATAQPTSPAPVGQSVMDRLRAQRDQQTSGPPENIQAPF